LLYETCWASCVVLFRTTQKLSSWLADHQGCPCLPSPMMCRVLLRPQWILETLSGSHHHHHHDLRQRVKGGPVGARQRQPSPLLPTKQQTFTRLDLRFKQVGLKEWTDLANVAPPACRDKWGCISVPILITNILGRGCFGGGPCVLDLTVCCLLLCVCVCICRAHN
jgi:hypothetical protein